MLQTLTALVTGLLLSRALRIVTHSTGPRLGKGELSARDAGRRASVAYWAAEQHAADGQCELAQSEFAVAERLRKQADRRTAKGDRSGSDLRSDVRHARKQLQGRCLT